MKIGDRIFVRGYIDEIRKDTVIVRNDGGYFGTIPSEVITGELPSVQPERKKGHWIEVDDHYNRISGRCSACGWESHLYEDDVVGMNFCPNCGARMEGEG